MLVFCTFIGGCACIVDASAPLDISIVVDTGAGPATFTVRHASVKARVHAHFVKSVSDFFNGR
jgi:hypothetical protein